MCRGSGNPLSAERTALIDKGGELNADGQRRIENALVAEAYGDVDATVLRRFSEATDDNTRSVVGAMADAAGNWSLLRWAMKRGDVAPEFDTTVELTTALRFRLARAKMRRRKSGRCRSSSKRVWRNPTCSAAA